MAFPDDVERLHKLAEELVKQEGTSSEKFGLRFGLYPRWAVEKARRLLKEQERDAELGSSGSSANLKGR